MVHPDHTQLVQAVRDWFHEPFQEMGYRAEKRRWGTYWSTGHVHMRDFRVDQVDAFLTDLKAYYEDRPVVIHIHDRAVDARVGPYLVGAGCVKGKTEIFLAHVGPVPPSPPVPHLTMEPVSGSNLRAFARTKLQAFAEDESIVEEAAVAAEMTQRRAELEGTGVGMLARVAGEPAGIIWWYQEDVDLWIIFLGTRARFRERGVASSLLAGCLRTAYEVGFRSVMINLMAENERALRLYRRLGFRDEISRQQRYLVEAPGRGR